MSVERLNETPVELLAQLLQVDLSEPETAYLLSLAEEVLRGRAAVNPTSE